MKYRNRKLPIVYAYGFDSLGYPESANLDHDEFSIQFISYSATDSLESADGLLIPSGIFETFQTHSPNWQPYTTCHSDRHRMAEREKQIFNAWEGGAWTCFLLRAVDNGRDDC